MSKLVRNECRYGTRNLSLDPISSVGGAQEASTECVQVLAVIKLVVRGACVSVCSVSSLIHHAYIQRERHAEGHGKHYR